MGIHEPKAFSSSWSAEQAGALQRYHQRQRFQDAQAEAKLLAEDLAKRQVQYKVKLKHLDCAGCSPPSPHCGPHKEASQAAEKFGPLCLKADLRFFLLSSGLRVQVKGLRSGSPGAALEGAIGEVAESGRQAERSC